jgi:hypothetical protein
MKRGTYEKKEKKWGCTKATITNIGFLYRNYIRVDHGGCRGRLKKI